MFGRDEALKLEAGTDQLDVIRSVYMPKRKIEGDKDENGNPLVMEMEEGFTYTIRKVFNAKM